LRIHELLVIALMFQLTGGMKAKAEDPHLGIIEYEISCMPCHGINGHGDGPLAKSLMTAPADLTKIAKSNRGKFPSNKVADIIDGRRIVAAHGQREMPVWGDRYRKVTEANETSAEVEKRARAQIAALVHPSGIEGLIFGSWAALSGERLSCVGPAEGPGHGGVEIGDELLDPGLQHLLAGEVAAADELSHQNGKPDFDLIEP
jgi:mono/diheme cytochrome c family protein